MNFGQPSRPSREECGQNFGEVQIVPYDDIHHHKGPCGEKDDDFHVGCNSKSLDQSAGVSRVLDSNQTTHVPDSSSPPLRANSGSSDAPKSPRSMPRACAPAVQRFGSASPPPETTWQAALLVQTSRREFDVSRYSTSQVSLMRVDAGTRRRSGCNHAKPVIMDRRRLFLSPLRR